jgi:hypothetical protein
LNKKRAETLPNKSVVIDPLPLPNHVHDAHAVNYTKGLSRKHESSGSEKPPNTLVGHDAKRHPANCCVIENTADTKQTGNIFSERATTAHMSLEFLLATK